MLNANLIKDYKLTVYMSETHRLINSKSKFNKQDIKTSVLLITLLDNKVDKKPLNITGSTIVAKILKNDNTQSTISCMIVDEISGVIAIGFTTQSLNCIGENILELVIQSGDQVIYSPKISYTIINNLYDESEHIPSQDEFPILVSLINDVHTLKREYQNKIKLLDDMIGGASC